MDEATHLTRAQASWQGHPFDLLLSGKALAPYLAALFDPFVGAPFIGRYVVVAIGAIGLTSALGLGRALHSAAAGVLVGLLWTLCTYLFFYERMALVDATLAALATFSAWAAVRMIRSGNFWDAVLCGIGLALCPFAKTTGVIYLVVPAAAILLPGHLALVRRIQQGLIAYGTVALLAILPTVYIASQGANVFGLGELASTDLQSLGDRLAQNPASILTAFATYFTWPVLLVMALAALFGLFLHPRRAVLPLTLVVVPLVVLIVVASDLYLRYLVIVVPGFLLLVAFGMIDVVVQIKRFRMLPLAGVVAVVGSWALLCSLPFMGTAYQDPAALALPKSDQSQYLFGWTSGYGLRDTASDLVSRADRAGQPITAIGFLGSCNTIRLYIPVVAPVTVQCPDVWDPTGAGMAEGATEISNQLENHGSALVVGEENGPLGSDVIPKPHYLLKTYDRPGPSNYDVELFEILGSDEGPHPGRSQ